ncbi:MAG: hypothetical protein ABEJ87_04065 [Candidatus Nanohalobium sp.]
MTGSPEDLRNMLERAEEKGWTETVRKMMEQEGDNGKIASNLYQGVLTGSRPQSENYPRLMVYEHSPGFESGETGLARVTGRRPEDEISPRRSGQSKSFQQDSYIETDYIRLEVLPEGAMPLKAVYDESGFPEVILEHEEVDMEEGRNVNFQVLPYDPEDITGGSWRQNLQNFEKGDLKVDYTGS